MHKGQVFGLIMIASLAGALAAGADSPEGAYREEVRAGVEEIYVFRTTRTDQQRGATPVCAAASFPSVSEDVYSLWSMELRASDSRVVNTHRKSVGEFHACLGQLAQDKPLDMYATGSVARIPWVGAGQCVITQAQPPARTVLALNCQINLSGLPDEYAGGMLTSNTLAPLLGREKGPTAHVPGYLSTSVVTVRLWKKPARTAASAD
jgi:hypothetical protein